MTSANETMANSRSSMHHCIQYLPKMKHGGKLEWILWGSLPETPRGHKYIMTLTDYYTKWAEAAALNDKSASSVADVLYSVSFQAVR